ncbi:thioredoxin peroxidase [Schizosaccharomyces japonicus yFS275]|uniref:Thioredoxin peroxidase n=1 Tax=Schizosaccharomyces japonicus (strain yFS275 / FY16936) TaxID=402676 RepID=B6K3I1_SCHJY|nr:thioredoxin peroxidase [Schizosaccharomyces japonicus yFS275]EEB08038.1 thioredoxin peroxidase [Schizosaccharomyces japonicus yFS275]
MIALGATLPSVELWENKPNNKVEFPDGKIIIVGVPGAFTPPCSSQVPGYVVAAEDFAAKGVVGIYIVAVNDVFVTNAWKKNLGFENYENVHFVSDWNGEFTKALGAEFDASGLLGPVRSKRYALVAENKKVQKIYVEGVVTDVDVSSAQNVLEEL